MRLPQLWATDLDGLLKWVQEVTALFNTAEEMAATEAEEVVSSETAGMARVWLGPTVPKGWLQLNGQYTWINEAQALYDLIGPTEGDPPNMFKLPVAPTALASGMWIVKS